MTDRIESDAERLVRILGTSLRNYHKGPQEEFCKALDGIKAAYGARMAMEERERCSKDAERYRWLRSRDLTAIYTGGIFIGVTPDNLVINLDDADTRIDAAIRSGADHDR